MYSIVENGIIIIDSVDSIDNFIEFIENKLHNEIYIFKNNISIETILNDKTFEYNKYLIHNENTITYLEKIKRDDSEYIHIFNNSEIKILNTWNLVKNINTINTNNNFFTGERMHYYCKQNEINILIKEDDF